MGLEALKRFDIYRKIPKDLTQATTSGALVSVCCVAFITLMLMTGNLFATNMFIYLLTYMRVFGITLLWYINGTLKKTH